MSTQVPAPQPAPGKNPETVPSFNLKNYLQKMKGTKRTHLLPAVNPFDIFVAWLGAFLGIGTVAFLTLSFDVPLMVASFGASAVLIYGVPDVPLAQPRNVIAGHVLSATTGVIVFMLFGLSWWSTALACSLSIVVMLATKTVHPPAGATGMIAVWTQQSPLFIVAPVFLGALILVSWGIITNNLSPRRNYPKYWF